MGKVIKIAKHMCICPVCEGNGYVRVNTGHKRKEIVQCEQCNSSGELTIEEPTIEFLEAMVASARLQ
jgi:DnaJ-class molecular chaperone